MSVHIVRLGTPRLPDEGLRLGTVRRPPRGVPKSEFAAQDWYDVWFPNLAPSLATMQLGLAAKTPAEWARFARKYRAEMATPAAKHDLALLAALSHATHFSVGYKMPIPLLADLTRQYPQVVGVNCTHPDLGYLANVIGCVGARLPVHVGGPMQGLTVLALGGHGYLSSEGNLAPRLCVSVIKRYLANDMPGMMDAFASFWYFGCLKFALIAAILGFIYKAAMRGNTTMQLLYMLSVMPSMLRTTGSGAAGAAQAPDALAVTTAPRAARHIAAHAPRTWRSPLRMAGFIKSSSFCDRPALCVKFCTDIFPRRGANRR